MKQLNRNEISVQLDDLRHRVDFIMKIAQATIAVGSHLDPGGLQKQIISFKDLYRELYSNGAELVDVDPAVQAAASAVAASGRAGAADGPTDPAPADSGSNPNADEPASSEPAPRGELVLGGVKVPD